MKLSIPAALISLALGSTLALADGKEAFLEAKCDRCHTIESENIEATVKSEKMKGPALDGVGKRHDAAWIVEYVKKEAALDGENHKASFRGSDDDLQAIADWLAKLTD